MATLNTLQAVETIGAWTSVPRVLKPHWPNPACEGGAVVEVSTNLTVNQLADMFHDRIIAVTYAAQALVVHCAAEQAGEDRSPIVLDAMRNQTDMIWHTDQVQRDHGSVNVIMGHSSVPTGLAPKPLIRQKALAQADGDDAQWPLKQLYGHWLQYDELELPYSDKAAYYLHYLHAISQGDDEELDMGAEAAELARMQAAFWEDIRSMNADPDILWFGQRQTGLPEDIETALFVSRMLYHNRGYAAPGTPRDGNKRRVELRPGKDLRQALDERFGGLRFDRPARGTDAEWIASL